MSTDHECPCLNPCVAHHNLLADLEARVDTLAEDQFSLHERVAKLEAIVAVPVRDGYAYTPETEPYPQEDE
ncbi:unnamed protein product [marine sediment metagenome]|uniref:Uncharacterized protein n=1 Tax=marine sediment metagenome TaxID=412755 RepID=X1UID1_9ZZZZ